MDVTPQVPAGRQLIQAYGAGGFRIANQRHEGSVLVFPERTIAWLAATFDAASLDNMVEIAAAQPRPEILLVGTGARSRPIVPAMRAHFRALGIMVDAMDTGAACRTYNILLAEDRRVAAALLPAG